MGSITPACVASGDGTYSMLQECGKALDLLLQLAKDQLPEESRKAALTTSFQTKNSGTPYFPCPMKQTEAIAALKAVEAGVASSIANIRYGEKARQILVDLERASCFLFSTYLVTLAGNLP